jgi:dihydropteroate synthase
MVVAREWQCARHRLSLRGRPLVMGIVNVTPDSFSDGGLYADTGRAVAHGLRLAAEGADLLDIGGESTRPGAADVPVEEECRRVVPVIERLAAETRAILSVDTRKAAVARAALEAGASIVNDVSALRHDPAMAETVRETGAGVILMHMQGTPATMQRDPRYDDVVGEVAAFLQQRVRALEREGVARERMAVDPGIGFGKTLEHNLLLLRHLDRLHESGVPVVVGLSRKRFLGTLTGQDVNERLAGSLAGLVFCMSRGVHVVRVHDVEASRDAVRVAAALEGCDVVVG